MAKAKKALSLVLAAVMLMGVMSLISFAADAPAGQEATIGFSYDKQSYAAGDTVTLTVKLTSNYFVASTAIPVEFDSAAAAYTGTGGVIGGALFGSVAATEIAAFPSDGLLYVALTPRAGQTAVAQQCADVVLFTATFTATTAISDPAKVFGVLDDQKTMSNLTGKLFVGSYATADITSTVYATGQTLTYPTLVVGGNPELILTAADNGAVIDRTSVCNDYDGFVYGISTDAGEMIESFVGTEVGSIVVNTNSQGQYSTGATIELKDASGSTVETYVFIFFGDINGDGFIDGVDVSAVDGIASYMDFDFDARDGSIEAMAANVNGDEYMDGIDVSNIDAVASYMEFTTQAEFAAEVAANLGIA